ncbi:hypothetical protein [Nocardioides psychrotolerans]|uniref:Uncharacterized protein n=1 Tax=Nocardioides psychrotolerans TaxID=1005945 RepID=A0A1I3L8D7_9ACTN|nr:hypothetical protein [Nocardioides psychrotolerans]SFI81062.1 hypothetical protein SAMN05216561_11362 [Nocardioides psychrotolerans]
MRPVHWWRRAALAVVVAAAVLTIGELADTGFDVARVCLLVVLAVAATGFVLDALGKPAPTWGTDTVRPAAPRGLDLQTQRYLSVMESHLAATLPDRALRDRLVLLAERTLRVRHGETPGSVRGQELLGPELLGLVDDPPRRLTRSEIERHVQRIESL